MLSSGQVEHGRFGQPDRFWRGGHHPLIGTTLSHFRILAKIGEGGMGVVYRAEDEKLRRPVALKVLPPDLVGQEERRLRFLREARAAAAVTHPNIATVYEVGESDGQVFIAMELVEGKTLREIVGGRPLEAPEAVRIAVEICGALEHAHRAHVVHRDVKPENIVLGSEGSLKVLDFGLAKLREGPVAGPGAGATSLKTATWEATREGWIAGTPAYMSPEQARGESTDHRTDIWSLGVVLYEMISGQAPFRGRHPASIIHAILEVEPVPVGRLRRALPPGLEDVIRRALRKEREARFTSAEEMRQALAGILAALAPAARGPLLRLFLGSILRPRWAAVAGLVLAAAVTTGVLSVRRAKQERWARQEGLPELLKLIEQDRFFPALALARRIERILPQDPILARQLPRISHDVSIETTPPGARIFMREYSVPAVEWTYLGRSPVTRRIAWGNLQWRVEREGYTPIEGATTDWVEDVRFTLDVEEQLPDEMVRVRGEAIAPDIPGLEDVEPVALEDFLIDRSEVTNRRYRAFVDAGGYTRKEYWEHDIIRGGRPLAWDKAMTLFRDATGRPGPATWSEGDHPKGDADLPVTGVSWYEAAAYAKFAGKELPTLFHWSHAAGADLSDAIVPLSNFGGRGPARVCSHQGLGPYGTCDMAGNVKEWAWNEAAPGERYILGGAWDEPTYMFNDLDAQSPAMREPNYGFRCMRSLATGGVPARAAAPVRPPFRDFAHEKPATDAEVRIYKSLYMYDRRPADPILEAKDEGDEDWTRETIGLKAPYGNERMRAHLFLPRRGAPPYQALVYFPGSNAIYESSSVDLYTHLIDFVLRSGRAVMWPIYKGTYERKDDLKSDYPNTTSAYRDHVIQWVKEVGASIDYLETRTDIDRDKLGFYGVSWGAALGALVPAIEDRFKVSVLYGGGLYLQRTLPEVDQVTFAPSVTIPTLMLNGRYDFFYPVETSQTPLFRLLGTTLGDKKHVVYESGHIPPRPDTIKEILDWLDRYLGPVER